jgi:Susd and RagB outer membrane lipoprotein
LGNIMPVGMICFQWDDTRMGAVIESFMVGLKDGRIGKYFSSPDAASLYADHPSYPYKGIRNGAYIGAKIDRVPYSRVSYDFNTASVRRYFTAAEVNFLKAEAALRGWNTGTLAPGTAKSFYENGIRLSFADWGGANVDTYIADATSKPIDYIDPTKYVDKVVKPDINNFTASSTITVAWNEGDSNELKLEKIMTQKWLNNFTNSLESWVDFRRTGYPKIPHVAKNDSSPDWGVIPADQWIKRMPFVNAERTGNTTAVADAVAKMGPGAKDDIATRLWWDTGVVANF